MKNIAIIPARSGSKGLKDKNIKELCGKPLIAYTIESAQKSKCLSRIIVSTDSSRYAEIAEKYGADVLMRGEKLSDDKASSFMVIEDVLKRINEDIDYFVLLQPTSPLRTEIEIKEAIALFEDNFKTMDFLVSMSEANHGRDLIHTIEDGTLRNYDIDFSGYRRQNTKEYYPNGAIFIGKKEAYLKRKHFFGSKSIAYVMDDRTSVDIDCQLDFLIAETIIKSKIED